MNFVGSLMLVRLLKMILCSLGNETNIGASLG